jgi:hypothetical protein
MGSALEATFLLPRAVGQATSHLEPRLWQPNSAGDSTRKRTLSSICEVKDAHEPRKPFVLCAASVWQSRSETAARCHISYERQQGASSHSSPAVLARLKFLEEARLPQARRHRPPLLPFLEAKIKAFREGTTRPRHSHNSNNEILPIQNKEPLTVQAWRLSQERVTHDTQPPVCPPLVEGQQRCQPKLRYEMHFKLLVYYMHAHLHVAGGQTDIYLTLEALLQGCRHNPGH